MTEADLKVAFASLDADGSGDITFSEFYAWFDGESADDAGGVGDTFDALAGVASDVGSGGYATSHEGSPRPSVGRHLVNSSPTFSVMSGEGQETRGVSNVGRPSGIGKRKTLLSKISQVTFLCSQDVVRRKRLASVLGSTLGVRYVWLYVKRTIYLFGRTRNGDTASSYLALTFHETDEYYHLQVTPT